MKTVLKHKLYQAGVFLSMFFLWQGCENETQTAVFSSGKTIPDKIDFNFHIKPILSDRCFACHGPDENQRKAGLALHEESQAFAELTENPGTFAIVPGKPGRSQLYHRIITEDPERIMPPPESNLSLSDYEIQLLSKWIKQGAKYKPHWSFIPPKKIKLPKVKNSQWAQNEIDRFVLSRLEREGLEPSEEASKEMLIRRLSFDIRGLPPSLNEIDAFLEDDKEEAYEQLVDRFLASPAYGERMAAHWLDVARYADSDGYLDDKHRDFSPWRDWVIEAFNQNLSYKDFITYQLAGDLLPNASKEQILATAFNRLHKKNSEAGIVFEEYRVEYVTDRTNTLGKAILGLSLECARCHDHKYDPISQKDYFKLFSFFNSTNELGHAVYGPDQTPGPALLLTDEEVDQQIEFILNQVETEENRWNDLTAQKEKDFAHWLEKTPLTIEQLNRNLQDQLVAHYPLDQLRKQEKEKSTSSNKKDPSKPVKLRNAILRPGAKGKAFFIEDFSSGLLGKNVGLFERTDPFSIDLLLYPDTLYEEAGVFLHCENLRLGFKGYSLHLKNNRPSFIIAHSWPQNSIQLTTEQALPIKEWTKLTITYDGSSRAEGLQLYLNGEKAALEIEQDNLYKGIVFEWNIHTYGFSGLTFGQRDKVKLFKNGGIDEIMIFQEALTPLEVLFLYNQKEANRLLKSGDPDKKKSLLKPYYFARIDEHAKEVRDSLQAARVRANELYNRIPEIMVMGDLPEPRPTFVLDRGLYDSPREEVLPGTPEDILPFPQDLPANRLGLTQWLFDVNNPLTARVIVNRIWQLHFGKGLVKTSEDFGNQGDLPTHPELLDWLANWLVEADWDLKALHKLILMSASYRQSSQIDPELQKIDPENTLLARGPRFRLPAEMIRDNALAISGLLVEKVGGKSTYPYQPEGLWDEISNKGWRYPYLQKPGEGLYRRSIYTIWKRTSPPPSMLIFDIADRDVCTVRRRPTNTPLQALVLLNDPQYQEAARCLAQEVMRSEEGNISAQLTKSFRLVFGRHPDSEELDHLLDFYQKEKEKYEKRPEDALAYLGVGEMTRDSTLPTASLAAMGVLVNGLMNTYEGTIKQ